MFAPNFLLQIEQINFENDASDDDSLALALCSSRFLSASHVRFASYSSVPFLMRQRHFARSSAICSQDSSSMLKSFREAFVVSL